MTFYAIVRDEDLDADDPMLGLIDSGRTLKQLRAIAEFDPRLDCTRVLRAKFSIDQRQAHPVRDLRIDETIPSHICALNPK